MENNCRVITIFLASPNDVLEERNIVSSIVDEINTIWSKFINLKFDLFRWETKTRPGVAEYTQDVINSQVKDDYDVFIGIFWKRIGSPSKNYKSNSIEEFERAYSKHLLDKNPIEIFTYFKHINNESKNNDDSKQIKEVINFKSSLGERGVLRWSFNDASDFKNILRLHLSYSAQHWSKIKFNDLELENTALLNSNEYYNEEKVTSINELLIFILDYYEDIITVVNSIKISNKSLFNKSENLFERIKYIHINKNGLSNDENTILINQINMIFKKYSSTMKIHVEEYQIASEKAYDYFSKALSLYMFLDGTRHYNEVRGFKEVLVSSSQKTYQDNIINKNIYTQFFLEEFPETKNVIYESIDIYSIYLNRLNASKNTEKMLIDTIDLMNIPDEV